MSTRLFFLGLLVILTGVPALRADDYFEQKKKEQALAAQKAVADVTTVLERSKDLEKKDAAQAKELLTKALYDLADVRGLDADQYKQLNAKLLKRLGEVEQARTTQGKTSDFNTKLKADKEAQADKERQLNDKQWTQGKSAYDMAKEKIGGANKFIDAYAGIRQMREKGFTDIQLDIAKTSAKMTEERITPYFIAKSELRNKNKLSKDEVALLKALNSTMTPDFDKKTTTFKDFLEYMQDKVPGLLMFVDEASLKEISMDGNAYELMVGFKVKSKVAVRTILKKVLKDIGLTYVIKDAAVQIISPDKMKDYLVTRAYPVADLVQPFDMRWGPYAAKAQQAQQAQQLMLMIVNMIEPQSWAGMNERGYGTIFFDPVTTSIIVSHTAEMHYQLGGGLAR